MTITMDIDPKYWRATRSFLRTHEQKLHAAMAEALGILHMQVRLNLSGPSHTLFPGNGNPFPGVITGRMRNSINAEIDTGDGYMIGKVGPNVNYARKHIDGDGVKKRNFLKPAWMRHHMQIRRIFQKAVRASLTEK